MILNATKYRPLWTPASLGTGPKMWYNDTSTYTMDSGGQYISTISDLSGNGLTAGRSGEPLQIPYNYISGEAAVSALNYKQVVSLRQQIAAADCGYLLNSTATAKAITNNVSSTWWAGVFMKKGPSVGGGSNTATMCYISTNATAASRFSICTDDTTNSDRLILRCRRLDADAIARLPSATTLSRYTWYIGLVTLDYTGRTGTVYLNGSQDAQNTTLVTSGNTSATNSLDSVGVIGAAIGTTNYASDALMAEVLIGITLPSAAEIDKINGYLAWHWGLQSKLPGGHAYKNNPPYL